MSDDVWLFAYGSIIWRTGFPCIARRAARLPGFVRRFWQGSHDHRGTPNAPGRVVTLIANEHGYCDGAAYLIAAADRDRVLDGLDHREKNGYSREHVGILLADGARLPPRPEATCVRTQALVYLAPPGNHAFLGEAPLDEILEQIRHAVGPSGTNLDYVQRLAESVHSLGGEDEHLDRVWRGLSSYIPIKSSRGLDQTRTSDV